MRFLPAEYIVLVLYTVIVIVLGVYVSNQGGNFENMLLSGRQTGLYGIAASFVATEWGAISLTYKTNAGDPLVLRQLFSAWALFFIFLIIGFWGIATILPRRKKMMTAGEILGRRFGKTARVIFGSSMTLLYLSLLAALLKVTGGIFSVFFRTSPGIMMGFLMIIATVYTISGGMWSVTLTNYVHTVVVGFMLPVMALYSIKTAGGFERMLSEIADAGAAAAPVVSDTLLSGTGAASVFGKVLLFLCVAVCFPSTYLRTCSAYSTKAAYKGYILGALSILGCAVFSVVIAAAAVVICPGLSGTEAYVRTIVASVPKGLLGLAFAAAGGIFMAACSSYFLVIGSMISKDVLLQLFPETIARDDRKSIFYLRMGIIMSAIITFFIGFFGDGIYLPLETAAVIAVSGGACCILSGLFWKDASSAGAIGSFFAGGLVYAVLRFGFDAGDSLSSTLAIVASFLAMILLSLLKKRTERRGKHAKTADA